jgi:hypothetical protein
VGYPAAGAGAGPWDSQPNVNSSTDSLDCPVAGGVGPAIYDERARVSIIFNREVDIDLWSWGDILVLSYRHLQDSKIVGHYTPQ